MRQVRSFDFCQPHLQSQDEAPINRMLRLEGNESFQADTTWLGGGGGDGGNGGSGGSGGNGWWREEDPYWPMRDWGDHPMRWWTLAFAALLAIGGVVTYTAHGHAESLFVGGAAAATLATCAAGMSDMSDWGYGPFAVKIAWAVCASMAVKVREWDGGVSVWTWDGIEADEGSYPISR